MLLDSRCPVCSRPGRTLCQYCAAQLAPAGPLYAPAGLDSLVGLIAYEGVGRTLVVALKFHNHRNSLVMLTEALSGVVDVSDVDLITWAPTSPRRRRKRGFDQAELLARALANHLRLPSRKLLTRKQGPSQTGRNLVERASGVHFSAKQSVPPGVLVIDDVVTTGATLSAAGETLRAAGARHVKGAVLAATP